MHLERQNPAFGRSNATASRIVRLSQGYEPDGTDYKQQAYRCAKITFPDGHLCDSGQGNAHRRTRT